MSDTLRTRLIRLAHAKPELRPHLLPLLAGTGSKFASALVVTGVKKVEVQFERVDEWHSTSVVVHVSTTGSGKLSERDARAWVTEHWREIVSAMPSYRTPPPAEHHFPQTHYDEDREEWVEEEDSGDYPMAGLGWVDPKRANPREVAQVNMGTSPRGVAIGLLWSIRDD